MAAVNMYHNPEPSTVPFRTEELFSSLSEAECCVAVLLYCCSTASTRSGGRARATLNYAKDPCA